MAGLFSRLSKNSRDGDWKLIKPIEMQTDLIIFSCSLSDAVAISYEIMA